MLHVWNKFSIDFVARVPLTLCGSCATEPAIHFELVRKKENWKGACFWLQVIQYHVLRRSSTNLLLIFYYRNFRFKQDTFQWNASILLHWTFICHWTKWQSCRICSFVVEIGNSFEWKKVFKAKENRSNRFRVKNFFFFCLLLFQRTFKLS